MRKTFYVFTTLLLVLIGYSCEKEDTTKKDESRSYQKDEEILQEFVRIDPQSHKYYVDLMTRDDKTEKLPKSLLQEAEKVLPVNKNRFIRELNTLNEYIEAQKKNGASYVIMQTKSDSYLDELSPRVQTENAPIYDSESVVGDIKFTGPKENSQLSSFKANDKVYTKVIMFSSINQRNLKATLECKTGKSINNSGATNKIVITSSSATFQGVFNWKNAVSGLRVNWTFIGKTDRQDILVLAQAYNGEYLGSLPEPI